jgi:hypothetical protein
MLSDCAFQMLKITYDVCVTRGLGRGKLVADVLVVGDLSGNHHNTFGICANPSIFDAESYGKQTDRRNY